MKNNKLQLTIGSILLLTSIGLLSYRWITHKQLPRVFEDYKIETTLAIVGLAAILSSKGGKSGAVSTISSGMRGILV